MKRALVAGALVAAVLAGALPAHAATAKPAAVVIGDSVQWEADKYAAGTLGTLYALTKTPKWGSAPCDWLTYPYLQAAYLHKLRPVLVTIETAGSNNLTACMANADGTEPAPGSPAFLAKYKAALSTLVTRLVTANHAVRIEWLGGPPIKWAAMDAAQRALTAWVVVTLGKQYPQLHVAWGPRAAEADVAGDYTPRLPCTASEVAAGLCPASGWIPTRASDGVHFDCANMGKHGCLTYSSGMVRWEDAVLAAVQP